jgi:membrane protease subunit (stomatin/prohibitin family)
MMRRLKGILEVIEYLDPTGQEIVHRVPEGGSGEIVLGSQCIVRENQVAIFFRDGRALDMLGPGRHTLSTMNLPVLVNYLKIPFGGKSPFRAEVVFVNLKDYLDQPWVAPNPLPFRDAEFGMVRLGTQGKFSFQVARPQQFVNQIVGTQGLYGTGDIVQYLQSMLISRLTDLIGTVQTSLLDLPAHYDELGAGLRAKASDDFEGLGLLLKTVYITAISIPPEVEEAIDERASMGAIGDMQAYMQFRAARALSDAAQAGGGEGGSLAGMGVGLGAGVGLGTAMASAIGQAMQPPSGASVGPSVPSGTPSGDDLVEGFTGLKNLVAQQLTLSAGEKQGATAALDNLLLQLTSSTATMADVRAARQAVTGQFSWLEGPVETLLNTPAALQMLGQIAARSM